MYHSKSPLSKIRIKDVLLNAGILSFLSFLNLYDMSVQAATLTEVAADESISFYNLFQNERIDQTLSLAGNGRTLTVNGNGYGLTSSSAVVINAGQTLTLNNINYTGSYTLSSGNIQNSGTFNANNIHFYSTQFLITNSGTIETISGTFSSNATVILNKAKSTIKTLIGTFVENVSANLSFPGGAVIIMEL